jgi:hypothetical protein
VRVAKTKAYIASDDEQEEEDDDMRIIRSSDDENDDDDEEDKTAAYERAPRQLKEEWKDDSAKPRRLPVITEDGKLARAGDDDESKPLLPSQAIAAAKEKVKVRKEAAAAKQIKASNVVQKAESTSNVKLPRKLTNEQRQFARVEAQERLAEIASTIIENPEESVGFSTLSF